jgi:4-hydroxybenzoate polyprenyltransferase
MALKHDTSHPSFIIGVTSLILLIVGVVFRGNSVTTGDIILAVSVLLGGIHWIWSIIDVARDPQLKEGENRVFWLTLVIIVAPVGGIVYYLMRSKRVSM